MKRRLYVIFNLVAVGWLLTACSDDAPQQEAQEDMRIELRSMTRADGDVDELNADTEMADIHAFLSCDVDGTRAEGTFKHYVETVSEDAVHHYWTAEGLKCKPGTRTFSLYGYMPDVSGLTGSMNVANYQLEITGIEPMTTKDICVVTGVRKSEEIALPLRGQYTFDYINSNYNERTILNLRLEHLLGRLAFKFKIGNRYSALRKITVTSLAIEAKAKETITATVNLPREPEDVVTVNYTADGDEINKRLSMLTTEDPAKPLSTTAVEVGRINVAVGSGLEYDLVSTYDVFDLQDNKLSTRTARNHLSEVMPAMGQVKEIILTVEPTYLYQLSDKDLNNPEVTIN